MDSSAIQLIQDTAVKAAEKNELLDQHGDGVAYILKEGEKIESVEQYQAQRRRFRGKFHTNSIADFLQYVKAPAEPRVLLPGFIDPEKSTAVVFFNLGNVNDPGHGDWTATLQLKQTAAYSAVCYAARNNSYSQKALIEFIEDWNPCITPMLADGSAVSLAAATNAIRKITLNAKTTSENTVGNTSASRSTFEDVEARGAGGLPDSLIFSTEPHLGFRRRPFTLRLIVGGDKEPVIRLRLVSAELHVEEIAQEFKSILFNGLQDAAALTVGTFTP